MMILLSKAPYLGSLLSGLARSYLDAYQQSMLRFVSEVSDIETRLGQAGRYVDPVFQHSGRHYVGFVRDLVEVDFVGFVEDAVEHVGDSLKFPFSTTLPMGFSFAVFFCQDVTDHCTLAGSACSPLFVDRTPTLTSVQYSLFTSAERTPRAWLKGQHGSSHTHCSVTFVGLKRICHLVCTCLTLCCSVTCRLPRAHHLPHSLFCVPRHQNTHNNRDSTIYSKNIRTS